MSRRRLLVVGSAGAACLGLGLLLLQSAGAAEFTAPGTTIGGLSAAGLDRAEIVSLLEQSLASVPTRLEARLPDRTLPLERADVGLELDSEATADRALEDSGNRRWWWPLGSRDGSDVRPVLSQDDEALGRVVERLQQAAARRESHGDLTYRLGEVEVVAPQDGREALADDVKQALVEAHERLPLGSAVVVPTRLVAAHVSAADLAPLADAARQLVTRPLTVAAGDLRAAVTADELAGQITVLSVGEGRDHGVRLGLRATASRQLAEPVARSLTRRAVEPRLTAPEPRELLSDKGDTTWRPVKAPVVLAAPGRPGQTVTGALVLERLESIVQQGARVTSPVKLPASRQAPASTDAQARSVDSVLGTFTTKFACCQPRVTNIRLIARTVDGALVAPGKQFSLNGMVGPRTTAKGYVEAPFILDGELSKDIGGGVSQFATTTMNAAFFAGLPLNQFKPHSFYIGRYPAGRESTVNYPGIDLRWTNDTGSAVLVRTSSTSTSITVTLYGKDDGRIVRAITGARTPVSGRDFRIAVVREIAVPNRPVRRITYRTTYNRPPEEE